METEQGMEMLQCELRRPSGIAAVSDPSFLSNESVVKTVVQQGSN
jgi:hypothetical protein